MLKDLQKSVEEEERVWKAKVGAAEEELHKSRVTVKHLEDIVEKLKGELESSDQVCLSLSEGSFLLCYEFAGHVLTATQRLHGSLFFFFSHGPHVQGGCPPLSKGFILCSLSDKLLLP